EVFDAEPECRGLDWKEMEGPLLERIAARQGGAPLYVVVEKILSANEELPPDWPTHGTSGYDFLNAVNGLFVDAQGETALTQFYRAWTGDDARCAEIVCGKKYLILRAALSSKCHMLGRQRDGLAQQTRRSRDFTRNTLRFVLRQVIACFPVYRS